MPGSGACALGSRYSVLGHEGSTCTVGTQPSATASSSTATVLHVPTSVGHRCSACKLYPFQAHKLLSTSVGCDNVAATDHFCVQRFTCSTPAGLLIPPRNPIAPNWLHQRMASFDLRAYARAMAFVSLPFLESSIGVLRFYFAICRAIYGL